MDQNDDYIYDAKFHPINPSLFASVDGQGRLDLWDVNKDTESPILSKEVGKDALNKVAWSSDGKRVAVGDINGKIIMYNLCKNVIY